MQDQKTKRAQATNTILPPIPDKLYFTIGEVGTLCGIRTHVLRYWEQEFAELEPCKRKGNRRYYQRKDIVLVRKLKDLLYGQGFTIEGARAQLSQHETLETKQPVSGNTTHQSLKSVQTALKELEALLDALKVLQKDLGSVHE
jgi:DNA-binding transcriptional MerR regulator